MKIDTLYFGEMYVSDESVLTFESGIPGFKDEKKFAIFNLPDNNAFQILQSIHTKELSLVLTIPYLFYKDYEIDLDEGTIDQLEIKDPEDVSVYSILTLQDSLEKSTMNLQAPVVVNVKNNQAKQIVLNDQRYKTKHPLQPESEEKAHVSANTKNR
ncbi:flagellar assembly protein FliW [Salinibacillus xinjiangensis]|uniref:Flagellar assembly factor FliW n=1 Tax=Salinibacillus xinjiangensis TaxID=1229268 RepID=A0A6G1X1B8_9BACI|nr:flagellar assembly protein FliW [Salinibacillus xinjiangensis]MRG84783.1 flagellar assembly protein FliW [Salinibacillus xinjiangensis]